MSLSPQMKEENAEEIIRARNESKLNRKMINALLSKLNIREEFITLQSQYFMSVARVKKDDLSLVSFVIMKREKNKEGKIIISLVSESLNSI